MNPGKGAAERALELCVWGFALTLPVSIAVSQPLAFLAALIWLYLVARGRLASSSPSPFRWPVMLFLLVAVAVSIFGVRPEVSLRKLDRFLALPIIFALPTLQGRDTLETAAKCLFVVMLFVVGATVQAAYDMIRVPVELWRGVALFDTGNMRDPQLYLVALCFLLAGGLLGRWSIRQPMFLMALALNLAGLVVHFKRGAWMSFVLAAALITLVSGRRKALVGLLVLVVALLAVPQVRDRLCLLREEVLDQTGGRRVLWTRVAPALIGEHPMGMGWKAPRHEDFLPFADYVQPKLNHLHNNMLQVTLELGWAGLAVWLYWMGAALVIMFSGYRRLAGSNVDAATAALGGAGGCCGLLINGMVEYNFGDSEIFMTLLLLMGLAGMAWVCVIRPTDRGAA